MPYGIQQPAISGQLLQLEKQLGLRLFERRPFALTAAGRELLDFVGPFFSRLDETADRLQRGRDTTLRLAAPATVLRSYLPELLHKHQALVPQLTLKLFDANQAEVEELLRKQEIDLAICELAGKPAPGLKSLVLFRLPLALLVGPNLKVRSAARLLSDHSRDRLVSLPETEVVTRKFQAELQRRRIDWRTSVEVSSLDLVATYVSLGLGVGLSIAAPGDRLPGGVRRLPLHTFAPVVVAALWRNKLSPANEQFFDAIRARSHQMLRQLKLPRIP